MLRCFQLAAPQQGVASPATCMHKAFDDAHWVLSSPPDTVQELLFMHPAWSTKQQTPHQRIHTAYRILWNQTPRTGARPVDINPFKKTLASQLLHYFLGLKHIALSNAEMDKRLAIFSTYPYSFISRHIVSRHVPDQDKPSSSLPLRFCNSCFCTTSIFSFSFNSFCRTCTSSR